MAPPQAFVTPLILGNASHCHPHRLSSRVVRAPAVASRSLFMTAAPGPNPEQKQQPAIVDASDFNDTAPTNRAEPVADAETHAMDLLVEESSPPISPSPEESKQEAPTKTEPMTSEESHKEAVAKEPEVVEASNAGTSVKLSPEDIETARKAREAAQKAAEGKREAQQERQKQILARAQQVCTVVGTRTKAFELGQRARAALGTALQNARTEAEKDNADAQTKLRASASKAAEALGKAAENGWNTSAVPWLKKKVLPQVFDEVAPATVAASTLAAVLTLVALPSLFSNGQPAREAPKNQLDAETAKLEKKLQRQRNLTAEYGGRSKTQSELFPPPPDSDFGPRTITTSKRGQVPSGGTARVDTPSANSSAQDISGKAEIPSPTTPKPAPEPPRIPSNVTPKPSAPALSPADVSPSIAMAKVAKDLNTKSSLVLSASFDSLKAEPTIVFEVSKAYHQLPAPEQMVLAKAILGSAQSLGYENISLVEQGTGIEVAHAGVGVVLEDEAENMRAELKNLRKLADKLAIQAAEKEAEVDKLQDRMLEERSQFASERSELEKSIKSLRTENLGLLEDLETANAEISKMPERFELEQRTLEAERHSEKMSDSVEMLSMQLAKARTEEAQAKQAEAAALKAVDESNAEKNKAMASVTKEIEAARKEAETKADQVINAARKEAESVKNESEKQLLVMEYKLQESEKQAAKILEDTTASYEKQLSSERLNKDKEVRSVQSMYEAKLEDLQKRFKTELDSFQKEADKTLSATKKAASADINALTKERDQAKKEVGRIEAKFAKTEEKAMKEKESLQSRISQLEAKLKEKLPEEVKETTEAVAN
eukprot:TRINITY_DN303_c0_g1_i1.p1 TRINITY_DN303_c0_g1~~TRINITY_DN303_c0_g1_i1.p1  ORF type:complete len:832 (+),score=192.95 TRINITY_DN303_c0_g1_i1:379-2874(+)